MTLKDLKLKVQNSEPIIFPLIIKCETDTEFYIVNEYLNGMLFFNLTGMNIYNNITYNRVNVTSLNQIPDENSLDYNETDLYVLETDELKEYPTQNNNRLVILCKKLPNDLQVDYIDVPKTANKKVEKYIQKRCPGLSVDQCEWLAHATDFNIHRIDNECKKIEMFPSASQQVVFDNLFSELNYKDLDNTENFFDLANAIVELNKDKIKSILSRQEDLDLEPDIVLSSLIRNYKLLSAVYYSKAFKPGICKSEKQYAFYKKVLCPKYKNPTSIPKIIKMLTEVDAKLKDGSLDYTLINEYIIINIFNLI